MDSQRWKPFSFGVALTLVVGITGVVITSDLRDRDDSASCHGARAHLALSTSATGGFIATVTVYDERKRDWELKNEYVGADHVPMPLDETLDPPAYAAVATVSDNDDGFTKALSVRPVGEERWCELKARIGLGF